MHLRVMYVHSPFRSRDFVLFSAGMYISLRRASSPRSICMPAERKLRFPRSEGIRLAHKKTPIFEASFRSHIKRVPGRIHGVCPARLGASWSLRTTVLLRRPELFSSIRLYFFISKNTQHWKINHFDIYYFLSKTILHMISECIRYLINKKYLFWKHFDIYVYC